MKVCPICGQPLTGTRSDSAYATYCCGACRAEAARLRAIIDGRGDGPYKTLPDRLAARGTRTNSLLNRYNLRCN